MSGRLPAGCRAPGCRNDRFRRGLCEAHWQLDMIGRRAARREREKAYRRSQPIDLRAWCQRQRAVVGVMVERVQRDASDLDEFAELAGLVRDMDAALGVIARDLHDRHGFSWTEFGEALGVSRQAARQRFARQGDSGDLGDNGGLSAESA